MYLYSYVFKKYTSLLSDAEIRLYTFALIKLVYIFH